jgi:hypothetical protein
MTAHLIAALLVWTCITTLAFSALFLALTAAPVLLRDLWTFLCADRSWRAEAMFEAPLPITEHTWSAAAWTELDTTPARDDHTFDVVEAWRRDGAA